MKIFNASFQNNQVLVDGVPVPDVTILSQGQGDSTGVLLMSDNECIYIAQISDDIKTALELLSDAFKTLSTDVVQASGGASDVGGAKPTFTSDMQNVSTKLKQLAGGLR